MPQISDRAYLIKLRQTLDQRFSDGELRTLCFDLGVDYDGLPGSGKTEKARELVVYCERRGRIRELLEAGQRLRPDISWGEARRETRERPRIVNLRPLDVAHTFKDRNREIEALCKYLTDDSVRLISIVGRGGMGKTALACRVLGELEQGELPVPGGGREFVVEGILYLSARSTSLNLDRIYTDVGKMLGEPIASRLAARWADRGTPLVAKVEHLLQVMQGGLHFILLDNLEDYLTEENTIAEEGFRLFIERCLIRPTRARLIITSRVQVNIIGAGLHNVRVIPLGEGLPEDDAVSLLRELDPQGVLCLRDAPEDDLNRAAHSTSGIPRALEILAGILHRDPTARLNELLDNETLFGEQVVETLVAEGYQRLGQEERWVIEALAVFDRPVTEASITYLLDRWFPGLNVRDYLRHLVSSYYVRVTRATGEYNLHPLDREYAYRQLPDDGTEGVYSRRNLELRAADFYASIRKPEAEWKSIDDLAPQLAEFEHRVRAEDYDGACQVLKAIDMDYLHLWGHYARLVEMRERLCDHLVDKSLQVANLTSLGRAYHELARFRDAVECYDKALPITREIGDRQGEELCLGHKGRSCRSLGQINLAIEFYEKALSIAHEIGNHQNEGVWLSGLGRLYRLLGDVERAIELYRRVLAIARQVGDRRGEADWLGHLGFAHHTLGQERQAIKCYRAALTIAHEIGYRLGEAEILTYLGLSDYALRRPEQSVEFYREALSIARKVGNLLGLSYCLLGLGRVLLAVQKVSEAREYLKESLDSEVFQTKHLAALALGITLLYQRDPTRTGIFREAAAYCSGVLDKTPDLYGPRYALAASLVGQAVCDPRWAEEGERADLLASALAEYQRALDNCSAKGVVGDAIRDLELIRAAGIEGLEPAFELLEEYANH